MERTEIVPHISWSGPQPEREIDAYLLAMLLRIYSAGLDDEDEERDTTMTPSVLTTDNLHMIAIMYAYYQEKMAEAGARNIEAMLGVVRDTSEEEICKWLPVNDAAIAAAEVELLEYVDTCNNKGFSAFG